MSEHERNLASAFDGQAALFEKAPVQSNPALLEQLVRFADLPANALVLDAGCGPGLVSEALLRTGYRVVGVDLSGEMIARARKRCEAYGAAAQFVQQSLFDALPGGPFDAAISRLVLHHTPDPAAFMNRQVELLRPGGVLVLSDHTSDRDPQRHEWLQAIQRGRDHTHTNDHTPAELVDLCTRAGLVDLRLVEVSYALDFDEWFDRGTPALSKDEVRRRLLTGPGARGFRPVPQPGGAIRIECRLANVRGIKP